MSRSFEALAIKMCKKMLAGEVDGVSSFHADVLRAALTAVDHLPDVAPTQKVLSKFMSEQVESVSLNDLLGIMKKSGDHIEYARARSCMSSCSHWPETANDLVESFMKAIIECLTKQVGF